MATITQQFTSNDKEVQKSLDTLNREMVKLREQAKKTSTESAKWTNDFKKGMAELSREAKKVAEDIKTPAERAAESIKKLQTLRATGKLTEEQYGRAVRKTKMELDAATQSQSKVLSFTDKVVGMAGAWAGIGSAVAVVNGQLQLQNRLQREALDTTMKLANVRRDLSSNLATLSDADYKKFGAGLKGISERTGMSDEFINSIAPSATSAQGNLPDQAVLNAIEMAATAAPQSVDNAKAVALGLLNASKLTKTSDAKANLGFQLSVGKSTAVVKQEDVNSVLVPAAIGIQTAGGDKANEAAAIVSTLTSSMVDETGRNSSTAAIGLADQLKDFLPAKKGYSSTMQRIEALQANPKLRNRFMGQANFELKAKAPIQNLLTAGTDEDIALERVAGEIKYGPEAAALAEGWLNREGTDPQQRIAAASRRLDQVKQRRESEDFGLSREAVAYRAHSEMMDATGMHWTTRVGENAAWAGRFWESSEDFANRRVGQELESYRGMRASQAAAGESTRDSDRIITALEGIKQTLDGIKTNQEGVPVGSGAQGE